MSGGEIQNSEANNERLLVLDGLRGIAILMVVFVHYFSGFYYDSENRWLSLIAKATRHFNSGVDLFFLLSGFLITRILLKNRKSPAYFSTFYWRRSLRILPLYLLLLVIYFGLQLWPTTAPHFTSPIPGWSYLTFTQNIFFDIHHTMGVWFMAVTWSLATEEHLYLLLPSLIHFCSLRTFVWTLILGGAFALLARMFEIFPAFGTGMHLPLRADTLFAGALIAVAHEKGRLKPFVTANSRQLITLLVFLTLGMLALTLNRFTLGCARYTWFTAFYAIILCLVLAGRPVAMCRFLKSRVLHFFGAISFGLYLFHQLVIYIIIWALYGFEPVKMTDSATLKIAGVAFVASVALSALLHAYIEKPAIRFGHRFKY